MEIFILQDIRLESLEHQSMEHSMVITMQRVKLIHFMCFISIGLLDVFIVKKIGFRDGFTYRVSVLGE